MTDAYLSPTPLLDFEHPTIRALVQRRGWLEMPESQRIGAIYDFVRDEIAFGYNVADAIPASAVLADGFGQCNTKTTLLMALLRGAGIGCRFHGATIHKRLQKGVVTGLFYRLAPENILHSWAEVRSGGQWVGLEGVILDRPYLDGLRTSVHPGGGAFLGFGVGTEDLADPQIEWRGADTAIQTTGINRDFGTFPDPDAFYSEQGDNLSGVRRVLFQHVVRHLMNRKVSAIRGCSGSRTS